jgi:hypothetical protein
MLLDLERAISRAHALEISEGNASKDESRNPTRKSEEVRSIPRSNNGSSKSRRIEVDSEGEMSVETTDSKKAMHRQQVLVM